MSSGNHLKQAHPKKKKKKKISNKPNGGKTNNTEIMTDTLSSSMEK